MSSSIPSWQILSAHAQPVRGARDLAFCLKVPLDSLLIWASSGGSCETARMRRLAWTFAARIGDKYQIRLTRSKWHNTSYIRAVELWWLFGKVYTLGIMVIVRKNLCLKPDGMELGVADYWNCGLVKFCNQFSHKIAHLGMSNENRCIIPLLSIFAVSVSCAVCLQLVLTDMNVFLCLLLSFLVKMFTEIHSCSLDFNITYRVRRA